MAYSRKTAGSDTNSNQFKKNALFFYRNSTPTDASTKQIRKEGNRKEVKRKERRKEGKKGRRKEGTPMIIMIIRQNRLMN